MNILLLEDEEPAAKRLEKMLKEIEPGIACAGKYCKCCIGY